ncbi:MAG: sensor domain-containing diguanylate cyclase [gamma proteobacterium symbiont of Taylorina sp.]|nr:sensor domain-containing diguanylate cyclase [gamma proteobacterium symbiont of Taylorina sp.]
MTTENNRIDTAKIGRFFPYIAGQSLLFFLLLIITTTYMSQKSLSKAQEQSAQLNMKMYAASASYFYTERKNDIINLAHSKTLEVFFSNRALGMSMRYGLRASLLAMQTEFQALMDGKLINHLPIYQKLSFITNNGEVLIETKSHKSSNPQIIIEKNFCTGKHAQFIIINNTGQYYPSICIPYIYKEQSMGFIVAEINHSNAISYLLHPEHNISPKYQISISDSTQIHTLKNTKSKTPKLENKQDHLLTFQLIEEKQSAMSTMIAGTSLLISSRDNYTGIKDFLTSPWYLFSLSLISILVLSFVIIGYRARVANILLQSRYEESRKSNNKFRALTETTHDFVWETTADGIYTYCSPQSKKILGYEQDELLGKSPFDLMPEKEAKRVKEIFISIVKQHAPIKVLENINLTKDGRKVILETSGQPFFSSTGELQGYRGIDRDITQRKKVETELKYMASHDALTELYNREVLDQRLSSDINRATRYKHPLSVFMLDIDYFKNINDTYTHQAGDTILHNFAGIISNSIRKTDYAARYGGEEFVVILPETSLGKAQELAERLRTKIAEYSFSAGQGKNLNITASIGIATFPEHAQCWEQLIHAADKAMYTAKKEGRNLVRTI